MTDLVSDDQFFTLIETSDSSLRRAILEYVNNKPRFLLESGEYINNDQISVFIVEKERIVNQNGISEDVKLKSRLIIKVKPDLVQSRPYAIGMRQIPEDIFPPSTNGFYGRIVRHGKRALYSVHRIEDSHMFWLQVLNPENGKIYEAHQIHPYEKGVFSLIEDWESDQATGLIHGDSDDGQYEKIKSILDGPAPSWSQIAPLLDDTQLSNFHRGKIMRDTTSQMVPSSFPDEIKEQLMIFLAYVMTKGIPKKDPVDYFNEFASLPVLRNFLMGHSQLIVDGNKWLSYVKLMMLADRDQLSASIRTFPESADSSWINLQQKMFEQFPDWRDTAINQAEMMSKSNKIHLRLPISRSAAARSRKAWKERLAMTVERLALRVKVNPNSIGLSYLMYLGAAYRWPHRHMSWIARLGERTEQPVHFHVMLMPPAAAERVRRFNPGVKEISHSFRSLNLDCYEKKKKEWEIPIQKILRSVTQKSSPRKIVRTYGKSPGVSLHQLTNTEARVLDFTSRTPSLSVMESLNIEKNWKITPTDIRRVLSKLCEKGVLTYHYEITFTNLVSLVVMVQGNIQPLSALTEAFLKHTPTSLAMLSEEANMCAIISRLTDSAAQEIASSLPSFALDEELSIRIMRPRSIRSYTNNLYQRLLKPDGTWDDDVSAFLSQARSKRKELSESNA